MKEDLLKIINNYGVIPQLKHFNSEVFELNEAIIRYEEADYNWFENDITDINYKKHITEEIADVCVMLHQFKLYYDIKPFEIYRAMEQKINRQLGRIEKEVKDE